MLAMGRSRFVFGSRWAKVLPAGKNFQCSRGGLESDAAHDNGRRRRISAAFSQPHA
jgi:hypothetical protein